MLPRYRTCSNEEIRCVIGRTLERAVEQHRILRHIAYCLLAMPENRIRSGRYTDSRIPGSGDVYRAQTMEEDDHRYVIAELDALAQEVADTIRRFEDAGVTALMKDDYVTLHALEHRIMEMRRAHADAISSQ